MNYESDLFTTIESLAIEKHINKQLILEAIVTGVKTAVREEYGVDSLVEVSADAQKGKINILRGLKIVPEITNSNYETTLAIVQEQKCSGSYQKDDVYWFPVSFGDFNRLTIKKVGNYIKKVVSEAEHNNIFREYSGEEGKIKHGRVVQSEPNYLLVKFQKTFAFIPRAKLIRNEDFPVGAIIKFLAEEVLDSNDDAQIRGSRISEDFLKKIMEQEVPEIFDQSIRIVRVARNPGYLSKVAVDTNLKYLDPVATCIGVRGKRINVISQELNGEKIDVCWYTDDLREFVMHALLPVKTIMITLEKKPLTEALVGDDDQQHRYWVHVVVPDEQYPIAVGFKGSNGKLVSLLTKSYVNIISYSQAVAADINIEWNGNLTVADWTLLKQRFSEYKKRNRSINTTHDLTKANRLKDFLAKQAT